MKEEKMCPRFVYEYANYQKRFYAGSALMREDIKEEAITNIDKAVRLRERGKITITEAMDIIGYPLNQVVEQVQNYIA